MAWFKTGIPAALLVGAACSGGASRAPATFTPTAVFDLGVVVTTDLPQRSLGHAFMRTYGRGRSNVFETIPWSFDTPAGPLAGTDSWSTLFTHAGPHVDAPIHMSVGGGMDSYPIEAFAGPVRVFDARGYPPGRTIPLAVFRDSVAPGDIVIVLTGYAPPASDTAFPTVVTITQEAAEYLAGVPVRAFGTDAAGVESGQETRSGTGTTPGALMAPVHNAFLSRGIPVYEQLANLAPLVGRPHLYFVGAPLSIKDGDGSLVRPVVFAY